MAKDGKNPYKPSFKTDWYRLYSPLLFRLYKVNALLLCIFHNNLKIAADIITKLLWDNYLAHRFNTEARRINAQPISNYKGQRKTNKLYILGCGPSINDLSKDEWNAISEHDSMGINYFYFHSFRPTYHFIELGKSDEAFSALHQYLLNDPNRKSEQVFIQQKNLIKMNKPLHAAPDRCTSYYPWSIKTKNTPLMQFLLSRYYLKKDLDSPLMHHTSNLDTAIHFAIRLGYKHICFVGVDLHNSEYFWDKKIDNPLYQAAKEANDADYVMAGYSKNQFKTHSTMSSKVRETHKSLSISDYLSLLDKNICQKNGITLRVCNKHSLLNKILDYESIQ